jgi:hypothetical protein
MFQVMVSGLLVLVGDVEECRFVEVFAHQLQADG